MLRLHRRRAWGHTARTLSFTEGVRTHARIGKGLETRNAPTPVPKWLYIFWRLNYWSEQEMNASEKNLAVARGEALAAHLMASAALQAVLMVIPNPLDVLARISAYLDDTLNMSGPGKGDA